jgi:hypothetical protein
MGITRASAKNKGRSGEQEILGILGNVLVEEYHQRGWPIPEGGLLRRGPNGKDIVGLSWLAPEIKRHEQCNEFRVEVWWEQAKKNANGGMPVLFWRQNYSPWNVRMYGRLDLVNGGAVRLPVDIAFDHFMTWYKNEVKFRLDNIQKAGQKADLASKPEEPIAGQKA